MNRSEYISQTFPKGVPRLWCPLLTHFRAPGRPDAERIHRLMAEISLDVGGLLVPGSTGEGWDMSDEDVLAVLQIVLERAAELGQHLLIGALKPTTDEMLRTIESVTSMLRQVSGRSTAADAMKTLGVAGFTICPPRGADRPQHELEVEVGRVMETELPIALYQLPQVTENEIDPRRVAALAERFENFFLFKDTSGNDRVALASRQGGGADDGNGRAGIPAGGDSRTISPTVAYRGVFLVRGAEGEYSRWPKAGGGPYDGLLLSTANTFSRELGEMLRLLDAGRRAEAEELSTRIDRCVAQMFPIAGNVPAGNAFANANKVFDHVRAFGSDAETKPTPMLYDGTRIPAELIRKGREVLEANAFDTSHGYVAYP